VAADAAHASAAAASPVLVPMSPARLADTRLDGTTVDGAGPKGALGPDGATTVVVAGRAGIPASGVAAVALNLTSVGATQESYLTVWPSGEARPLASNLNPLGEAPQAILVSAKVGVDGSIAVYNAAGWVRSTPSGRRPAGTPARRCSRCSGPMGPTPSAPSAPASGTART
jgi:hypothetical protein